jgi:hypothetical protein
VILVRRKYKADIGLRGLIFAGLLLVSQKSHGFTCQNVLTLNEQSFESTVKDHISSHISEGVIQRAFTPLHDELNSYVEKLNKPDDIIEFIKKLPQFERVSTVNKYDMQVSYTLLSEVTNSDLIEKIIELKSLFSLTQIVELNTALSELDHHIPYIETSWRAYQLLVQFIFDPNLIFTFIDRLPTHDLVAALHDKSYTAYFNSGVIKVLKALPTEQKKQAYQYTLQRYYEIRNDYKKLPKGPASLGAMRSLAKTKVRNYELMMT